MFGTGARIAIVDDDESVRRALFRLVLSLSLKPSTHESGSLFMDSLSDETPECVLLDLNMPGMSGEDVLSALNELGTKFPVIVMTGFDKPNRQAGLLDTDAAGYLAKPISRNALLEALRTASTFSIRSNP